MRWRSATPILIAAVWASGCLLGQPTRAAAETLTLPALRDNTLFEASPPTLSNGAGAYMFVGQNANGQARRALLRFDLSSLPATSQLQSVRLQLYMSQTSDPSGVLVRVRALTADWGEGTSNSGGTPTSGGGGGAAATTDDATWLYRFYPTSSWSTPGGDFAAADSATQTILSDGFYTFADVALTSDVQNWLANPSSNFGWILLSDTSAPRTAKRFNTHENSDAASRPQLVVDYTPAPASVPLPASSLWLCAIGLLLTACSVRSRRPAH